MTNTPTPPVPGQSGAPAAPSLQVDSDWKAQAQAERERLAKQEAERATRAPEGDPDALPPAEFRSLVGMLASQAIMGLGTMGDQQGRVIVDLPGAQFAIEILDVLREKTKGNLTPDEARELEEIQRELKARFMQVARLVTEQIARGQAAPAPGAPGMGGPATGFVPAASGPAGLPGAPAPGGAPPAARPANPASKLIIP